MNLRILRNTLIFWLLLLAVAFGQPPRDPTLPSPAIAQKLATTAIEEKASLSPTLKLKAMVLSDRDHGTALLQSANGSIKVRLARDQVVDVVVDGVSYTIAEFTSASIVIKRGGQQIILRVGGK